MRTFLALVQVIIFTLQIFPITFFYNFTYVGNFFYYKDISSNVFLVSLQPDSNG